MRQGTTEYALMVLFNSNLLAKIPLSNNDRLADPNFPLPISIIFGD
jgi:hypothetical protein